MSKKKPTKKKQNVAPKKEQKVKEYISKLSNIKLLGITLLTAIIYWIFSFYSDGMYQGEEGIHYINMKEFWENPRKILGNWAKPGWKIAYLLPSLGGFKFLFFFNSLVSAFAGFIAYKIAEQKGMKAPWLVLIVLFSQFFWFHLAFRNYSELISALLLVAAVYYNNKSRYLISALLVSYLLTIRQEWVPIIFFYGLFLLYKRQWIAAFAIALFPVLVNMWGWAETGDPLHLVNDAIRTSSKYAERYPRQGFGHYFSVALPILGPITLAGLTAYVTSIIKRDQKPDYFLIFPSAAFFLLLCILNIKDPQIGTSTAGNWRYLFVICPLLAIMASLGFKSFYESKNKVFYLVPMISLLVIALLTSAYKHNFIALFEERDPILMLTIGLTIAGLAFPLSKSKGYWLILVLGILFNLMYIRPKVMVGENKALRSFIPWTKSNNLLDKPILYSNNMLLYFLDKTRGQFKHGAQLINKDRVEEAEVGTYVIWDSHYTKRESGLDYKYFQEQPNKYKLIKQLVSDDKRFVLLIFEKIAM